MKIENFPDGLGMLDSSKAREQQHVTHELFSVTLEKINSQERRRRCLSFIHIYIDLFPPQIRLRWNSLQH